MPRTRNPYPAEFGGQVIALACAGGSVEDLAREFEPCAATIHGRVKQADRDGGRRADGLTSEERDEPRRLMGVGFFDRKAAWIGLTRARSCDPICCSRRRR